jgi:hypothetical protein
VERLERCARGLEEAAGRAGFQAQIDAYLDGAAFLRNLASLRAASTQPNPTTHLSEGTRDRLEAAGREFDTRVKNQESVHEPLPEDRIREIYESHATTPQPQDEEER